MPTSTKLSVNKLNQRGAIQFLIPLILIIGIIAGVYLVQKTQIFKPKAASEKIDWVVSDQDPDNCVTINKEGKKVTTCPKVKFKIDVPAEVSRSK